MAERRAHGKRRRKAPVLLSEAGASSRIAHGTPTMAGPPLGSCHPSTEPGSLLCTGHETYADRYLFASGFEGARQSSGSHSAAVNHETKPTQTTIDQSQAADHRPPLLVPVLASSLPVCHSSLTHRPGRACRFLPAPTIPHPRTSPGSATPPPPMVEPRSKSLMRLGGMCGPRSRLLGALV